MKVTWLGQAGLLFDNGKVKIMVDPYLSDSVEKIQPKNYRRIAVKKELFDVQPDVMIFTHDHLDHYDPETAEVFLGEDRRPVTVLAPTSVWQRARLCGGPHNYVLFDRYTQWSQQGVRFYAVKAAHSDPCAVGVIIEDTDEGRLYYITGDTLYSSDIFEDLPCNIDVVFVPINGVGNNMNAEDAARFVRKCGAMRAVPLHVGMFDEHSPAELKCGNKLILDIYKETEI